MVSSRASDQTLQIKGCIDLGCTQFNLFEHKKKMCAHKFVLREMSIDQIKTLISLRLTTYIALPILHDQV